MFLKHRCVRPSATENRAVVWVKNTEEGVFCVQENCLILDIGLLLPWQMMRSFAKVLNKV